MLDADCVRKKNKVDFLERDKAVWLFFSRVFELVLNFAEQDPVLSAASPSYSARVSKARYEL